MSGTTKNGVGKIITYIAVLLIFVLIFGVLGFFTNGFTSDFKTFYVENNGETVIGESMGNGVKVMSAKIAKEDYVTNGISPLAETAYTLTATVLPADTTNKKK